MADAPAEHASRLGEIAAAFAGAVSATGALWYRRKKKPPTLTDEEFERIQGNVIAALRREMQASLESHENQMQHALSLIDHGVLEIKRLVIDVPAIKGRLSQLESGLQVVQGDITEIRGELKRNRER